jgi:hypothetical protein
MRYFLIPFALIVLLKELIVAIREKRILARRRQLGLATPVRLHKSLVEFKPLISGNIDRILVVVIVRIDGFVVIGNCIIKTENRFSFSFNFPVEFSEMLGIELEVRPC